MNNEQRAKQFASFDALRGFKSAIKRRLGDSASQNEYNDAYSDYDDFYSEYPDPSKLLSDKYISED